MVHLLLIHVGVCYLHLLDIEEHMRRLASELNDLLVVVVSGIVERGSLEYVDTFIGLVACSNQKLEYIQESFDACMMHRCLTIAIRSFDVGVVFHEQIG